MKRMSLLLSLLLFVCVGFTQTQQISEELDLQVKIIDPIENNSPIPRSPVKIPSLCIEGHTLFFATSCEGCILQLVQNDDEVVYSTIITSDIVELPESLSGTYELQIIRGNYCFWAEIEL